MVFGLVERNIRMSNQVQWENLLRKLCQAPGPAGMEAAVAAVVEEELKELGLSFQRDGLGSLIVRLSSGHENAPLLMVDAHMDEIGLVVSAVSEDGYLKFAPVGGLDKRILPGSEVMLLTNPPTPGIICCLPPHVQTAAQMNEFAAVDTMGIDTGLPADEVKTRVPTGTFGVLAAPMQSLAGGHFSSKALDNRALCAVLVTVLKRLAAEEAPVDVAAVFSVQEEAGCRGAGPAAFGLRPDAAIVLDVTYAKAPGLSDEESYPFGNLTVCLGPFVDRSLSRGLLAKAKELEIPVLEEVYGGSTGTNATPVSLVQTGVPCAVLSVPIRNMHTPVEIVSTADLDKAADLLTAFIKDFPKGGAQK